jgi:hypothetical protein
LTVRVFGLESFAIRFFSLIDTVALRLAFGYLLLHSLQPGRDTLTLLNSTFLCLSPQASWQHELGLLNFPHLPSNLDSSFIFSLRLRLFERIRSSMGKPFLNNIAARIRPGGKADADAHVAGRDLEKGVDDDPDPDGIQNQQSVKNLTAGDGGDTATVADAIKPESEKKNDIVDSNAPTDTSTPPVESATINRSRASGKLPPLTRFKKGVGRFGKHSKNALLHSYVNLLLVFVPIGIAAKVAHLNPAIVFAMNAVAIIPLAGVLTHATESVAVRLGDTLGALLNVSFGNAVELIIFIIALVKDEIRIVQASVLGSILANLLLILGMAFLFGGLRYREQLYNNIVTQMSACLLSLSVISLLLPTAFHASFNDTATANAKTLQVSRGASVVSTCVPCCALLIDRFSCLSTSFTWYFSSSLMHICIRALPRL